MIQNAVFIILALIAFAIVFYFVAQQSSNAGEWSDYYVKEITKTINLGKVGDTIELDVSKATSISKKENLRSISEVFVFENSKNKVCVKLNKGRRTCYYYYNNVDIVNPEVKIGFGDKPNTLVFKLEEKTNNE